MLFDSHCHLNHPDFKGDYKEIIADCLGKQIGLLIVGDDFHSSRKAGEIASEYPKFPIYFSVGVHPDRYLQEGFESQEFQALLNDKALAVGEIGLDYFERDGEKSKIDPDWKQKQGQGFEKQLTFAETNRLPVILHARGSKEDPEDSYLDMLEILKEYPSVKGVIHCFGSTERIAAEFLRLGFYIGFTGIITFTNKSADPLREVVKFVPLDKILVETDAPYLSPDPYRGQRCLPQYVELVAKKVAELKGVSEDEVKNQTTKNMEKLFLNS